LQDHSLVLAGLRLGLKNRQVGEKWVSDDCSYLCKGLLYAVAKQTKTTHFSNHLNQQNCFLSSTAKNLRYFTKNKPSFCQKKMGGFGLFGVVFKGRLNRDD
jgi:hypothetical protein